MDDVIIYFHDGTTARFQQVTNFNDNGPKVMFKYFGVSTQMFRRAEFNKNIIAGYVVNEEEK